MVAGSLGSKATPPDEPTGKVARDVVEGETSRHERVGGHQNPSSDSDDHVVAVGRRDVHFAGGSRDRDLVGPRRTAVGALPKILVAAHVHAAVRAWIGRDGGEIDPHFRGQPWWRDTAVGNAVVRRSEDRRVAPPVDLRRHLPVVRDVEAVAANPHLPGRRDCARRRYDAVVLESAEGHARSGVRLDVEVVEQCGLETTSVERREVDAARAPEDASVIAAIDDGEGTGLRRESP